jgi:hypothetical protein
MNVNGNGAGAGGRPSDGRRKALNAELTVPSVSNFFPIENYYDAADKVYESFQLAFLQSNSSQTSSQSQSQKTKSSLDDAYVYGKRYCMFCIQAIPEHNYYNATRYRSVQVQHTKQVQNVLTQLEQVATAMDKEELEKTRLREIQIQKKKEERERIERKQYEDLQRRVQRQMQQSKQQTNQNQTTDTNSENLEVSALSKLELLRKPELPTYQAATHSSPSEDSSIRRDPSGEEPKGDPSSRYRLAFDDDSSADEGGAYPPPMLPPTPYSELSSNGSSLSNGNGNQSQPQPALPPSYDQALRSRPFLGPGVKVHPVGDHQNGYIPSPAVASPEQVPFRKQQPKKEANTPMKQQQKKFVQDYVRHQREGKIEVTAIDTYQGRKPESTNGCTVISALVAAFHLVSHGGITNSQVCQVIDRECGPLLREIRSKLGLGESALIIPSDVHDHLVDRKVLHQKHFEGAAGGNIMDPDHFGEFIKLISVGDDGKAPWSRKAAATLFFREHVISIVKFPVGPNQVFYDLVDSLPGGGRNLASRTRCKDVQSLEVLLRWYTTRKFSDTNCAHIDGNPWDDNMADMDPRVFQGFVWAAKQ